jgi:hypothetical protein
VFMSLGRYRTASISCHDHLQLVNKSEWWRLGDTELVKEEVA